MEEKKDFAKNNHEVKNMNGRETITEEEKNVDLTNEEIETLQREIQELKEKIEKLEEEKEKYKNSLYKLTTKFEHFKEMVEKEKRNVQFNTKKRS